MNMAAVFTRLDRAIHMVDEPLQAKMAAIVTMELTSDSPFSHG